MLCIKRCYFFLKYIFLYFFFTKKQNHTARSFINFGIDSYYIISEHNDVSLVADHTIPLKPVTSRNSSSISESISHSNTSPESTSTSLSPNLFVHSSHPPIHTSPSIMPRQSSRTIQPSVKLTYFVHTYN